MGWADDIGTCVSVEVQCVQPTETPPFFGYQKGCGWKGTTLALTQYGATGLYLEECPECAGPISITEEGER